jgi:hypothetical protein
MWERYADGEYYKRVGAVSLWVLRAGKFWRWSFVHDTDPMVAGSSFRAKLSFEDAKTECCAALSRLLVLS